MSKKTQTLRRGEVLVMKVVEAGGGSHNGFIWPTAAGAEVEAPDWMPTASCGKGLHGWMWGPGRPERLQRPRRRRWLDGSGGEQRFADDAPNPAFVPGHTLYVGPDVVARVRAEMGAGR